MAWAPPNWGVWGAAATSLHLPQTQLVDICRHPETDRIRESVAKTDEFFMEVLFTYLKILFLNITNQRYRKSFEIQLEFQATHFVTLVQRLHSR